jgi:hypothetical protein
MLRTAGGQGQAAGHQHHPGVHPQLPEIGVGGDRRQLQPPLQQDQHAKHCDQRA